MSDPQPDRDDQTPRNDDPTRTDQPVPGGEPAQRDEPPGADPAAQADKTPPPPPSERPTREDEPPRLGPRPLDRPPVDAGSADVFGRPSGVAGAFAPVPAPGGPGPAEVNGARRIEVAPPHHALVSAFSRPHGVGTDLQRPPDAGQEPSDPDPFWEGGAGADPWRDPAASARLGPPAAAEPTPAILPRPEGARLSARELVFGKRVKPTALALLGVIALLIGAVGGLIGKWASDTSSALTEPGATIAEAAPGKERAPGSIAGIAARVVPAVVSIQITVGEQGGTGSGVVIDNDGYVLTNNHVIAPAAGATGAKVEAVFHDGTRVPAQIVGRDPKTDLAVIKVNVPNPTVAQIGSSDALAVGDEVIAVGSPLGLESTVTNGIVSALNRPVRLSGEGSDTNAVIDAIQTDAAINFGNSGGPLVDSTGAVVGLNTAIRTGEGSGGSIGLGFAIPIDFARKVAELLMRGKPVKHADLGVNVAKPVTDGRTDGAQVQNVRPGSAGAEAGIVEQDVIVKIGDRIIRSANEMYVAVVEHNVGDRVQIQLIRQGRPLTVTATLRSD
ncbi:trypsin-like peptidase domain-containing protein [Pseudonocardia acaciae]|uniref:trypsin-like peptidase domain-containing protein n=1 Tax=Pseudonocardia acaciae TaxID=551276 RepID=UPI000A023620|nr:trypsin-like peptidase domain-containing protein [Pseudonocardia acaciae]